VGFLFNNLAYVVSINVVLDLLLSVNYARLNGACHVNLR